MLQKIYYGVAIIFATVLTVVIGKYAYDNYYKQVEKPEVNETESVIIPTIEQRMNDWKNEQQMTELYDLSLELPEQTFKAILGRIGTTASYEEIATEYLRNKNYYLSLQIKNALPPIVGPDRNNVQEIEIKTKLKPEQKEETYVPGTVKDSLK